jgi:F0F1-type ATP synthase alpha subunit
VHAVSKGSIAMIKLLLKHGANAAADFGVSCSRTGEHTLGDIYPVWLSL